jgi:hypothetical protein
VALAASDRAWRGMYRQRESAFAEAMADWQEWEHPTAMSGQRPTDQERSFLAAQAVGAAAGPERHSV